MRSGEGVAKRTNGGSLGLRAYGTTQELAGSQGWHNVPLFVGT